MEKKLFTIKETAKSLNVSERTVRRDIDDGFLEAVKIRGCLRVTVDSIDRRIREAADLHKNENGVGIEPDDQWETIKEDWL